MAARNLLPACLSLALLTAPVGAWADKPQTAEARKEAAEKKKQRAAERKKREAAEKRAAERKKREEARRRAEEKRREAEEKRRAAAEKKQREAEEKRRAAAEKKQREAEARRQQQAAARRRALQQEKREAARRAAEDKQRAQARQRQQEKEAARRQAELERRAEARRQQEEAARRRALEQEKREAARRAAEETRRAEARAAAEEEARRRVLAAQRVEAARRAAELQREAEARQQAEERAARATREALRQAGEQEEAEARRKAEARAEAEQEAAARAAATLAEQAERNAAARDLARPALPQPTALGPTAAAPADDGGTVSGRGYPMRREPPPVGPRPIPRPDEPTADGEEPPAGQAGARQPIPRPTDDGPAFGRRDQPDGAGDAADPDRPAIGRRAPQTRPRPDGPRRGDRASPREGRERWDDTVDRVAEEAGRPPPPRPVRTPWPRRRDDRRDGQRHDRDGFVPMPRHREAPEREYEQGPPPIAAPAGDPDLDADLDPGLDPTLDPTLGAPIGRSQQALSADPGAGGAGPAPKNAPDITLGARPLPTATPEARATSDWFDGFTARGAYAGWSFLPVGDLPAGAGAFERYTAEGLDLYRVDAILDTRWARLQARYESNSGFSVGRDDVLLDLLVGLRAVPGLEGLTFEYLDLDFVHGRVELVEPDGSVVESTPLKVDWRTIDLAYPLHDHVKLFGRRFDSAMPRNVYLERASSGALPISEQLLTVDTTAWGVGLDLAKADDGEGLFGGLKGWLGVGPYDIRTVSGGAFLDGGWLTAGGVEAHIGWRQPLGGGFSIGVHDTLTLVGLDPNGLPTGMQRDLDAAGLPRDDLSLRFGTVEVLNGLHIDLTWSI